MQMPSTAQMSFAELRRCSMEGNAGKNSSNTSLHNQLANFVLDLQNDVRLEDLLDNNNENTRANSVQSTPHIPAERREVHIKQLRHLYDELKNQQCGLINSHEQPSKRRHPESSPSFGRHKVKRNADFLLHDTDSLDEAWLMNFASQLGLDKKRDLPELNYDIMQELIESVVGTS